ncbi:UNVERIFIED_CONTAM: hypothetical protein FKN15_044818 [Acipenser sinensis]
MDCAEKERAASPLSINSQSSCCRVDGSIQQAKYTLQERLHLLGSFSYNHLSISSTSSAITTNSPPEHQASLKIMQYKISACLGSELRELLEEVPVREEEEQLLAWKKKKGRSGRPQKKGESGHTWKKRKKQDPAPAPKRVEPERPAPTRKEPEHPTHMRGKYGRPTHMREEPGSPTHMRGKYDRPTHMREEPGSPTHMRGSTTVQCT